MPQPLYEVSVVNYLQILDAMAGFLAKGATWCEANGVDLEELVETRLFSDMRPFRFQVQQAVLHSLGSIEAVKSGSLGMPGERPQLDYAGLQALVDEARAALRKFTPEEINAREGQTVVFNARGMERLFTSEGFVASFSMPNFFFHVTTAYNILRSKGVPVGKMDFVGQLRLKG